MVNGNHNLISIKYMSYRIEYPPLVLLYNDFHEEKFAGRIYHPTRNNKFSIVVRLFIAFSYQFFF